MTPAGSRGKVETPQAYAEEARLPPRGKQVSGAQCSAFTLKITEKATIYTKTAFQKDCCFCTNRHVSAM